MGHFRLRTKNGYDFLECASALQKSIRRDDVVVAAFFGVELWQSGYGNYVWKRLYTISAEDCWGLITHEIDALHNGYELVNKGSKEPKGRIFIGKAIILLCECYKSRDADHLNNLAVDKLSLTDSQILARERKWARPKSSSSMTSTTLSIRDCLVSSTTLCLNQHL